jgi:hypothetical protein
MRRRRVKRFQEGLPVLEMASQTLALFRDLYVGLVETTALHKIVNGRDYKRFLVIEGPVHELQMFLHQLLRNVRGRERAGRLLETKSSAMRLRTFFCLINTPQTPYSQAAQGTMLINLHRGRIGLYVPLLAVGTPRKAFHSALPLRGPA